MNNLIGRDVSLVRLHTSSHAKGFGQISTVVDKTSGKHLGDVTLTVVDQGVLFQCGGTEVILYAANIISVELTPGKEKSQAV